VSVLIEKKGPTGLITTTTAASLHPENETRMLSLQVKDTPEQTKAILQATARKLGSNSVPSFDQGPWHALQLLLALGERRVSIPYAETLSKLIPPVAVRLRRDFRTMVMLIKAHALLHWKTRNVDKAGQILATLEDYEAVRALISDALSEGLGKKLNATVRQTVKAVEDLLAAKAVEDKHVSTLEVANRLKLDKSAAKRRIHRALTEGYLHNLETRPRQPSKIMLGAAMPEDAALLPSKDELGRQYASLPPENACPSAPVADNPISAEDLLAQMPVHQSCTSEPASAPDDALDTQTGALDTDWRTPPCTSIPIEISIKSPTGALDTAFSTPSLACPSPGDVAKGSEMSGRDGGCQGPERTANRIQSGFPDHNPGDDYVDGFLNSIRGYTNAEELRGYFLSTRRERERLSNAQRARILAGMNEQYGRIRDRAVR
jgi:hypothetical protein